MQAVRSRIEARPAADRMSVLPISNRRNVKSGAVCRLAIVEGRGDPVLCLIGITELLPERFFRSGLYEIHCATAEAAARHACAIHAGDPDRRVNEEVNLFATDFVVVLHAAMRRDK